MRNYIILNNRKYKCPNRGYEYGVNRPLTIRPTLLGAVDAVYGSSVINYYEGEIEGPVVAYPMEGGIAWGTIAELRAVVRTVGEVTMEDHYGTRYAVHIQPDKENSMSPMWDGASNVIKIKAHITIARAL